MRVSIELLDVTRHDSGGVDGADKDFYVVSAFHVGTQIVQIGLTTPISLLPAMTRYFDENERSIFYAEVPLHQHVQGGCVAFATDFSLNWMLRPAWLTAIKKHMMQNVLATAVLARKSSAESEDDLRASTVLAAAVDGWYCIAPQFILDEEVGQLLQESISPAGPATQTLSWHCHWMHAAPVPWEYTVRYCVRRF